MADICLVGPNRLNLNETGHCSGTGYGVNLVSLEVLLFMTSRVEQNTAIIIRFVLVNKV